MSKHWEQNKDATVYVGNIDERFSQDLLTEMMTQAGPVRQVHMPQDRVSQSHQGYGFVEFDSPASADYASKIMNGIRVFGKPIRVNKASADKQKTVDIGAELFINNLDPQVDEKVLYDAFCQFGGILRQPNIIRDENNISKGYGFISFDSFEASDAARDALNGQYILSQAITVEYAYKKDGKGERHGDEAERKLAREGKKHNIVPEQQQLPAAFHMSAAAATPSVASVAPVVSPGAAVVPAVPVPGVIPPVAMPPVTPVAMHGGPPPYGGAPITPVGPPAMGRGGPPLPYGGMPPVAAGRMPMPMPGLPPAPSGLPARPPPSQTGFGGPGDFHPGGGPAYRGGPPPGQPIIPPGPPGMYPGMPGGPPGGPVPGFPGAPPPGAPMPPGFIPPPAGFGPPPVPPPNGYPRR
ncbi:putative spliceosome-associated protein [Rhypophila decipiens]|uniref:Spliceosome-associated protein n=1 Tax=Rhypophila decipiens TaxID=261697 RepID=A0AAN6Y472_9PEZI|nr:putative spliceosome-associated protein [Rhypophila decipiens]